MLVDAPIHSDGYSYYVYLPAWFLTHDPSLQQVAMDCCGGTFPDFTSIYRWPETGRWVNPHPIGVAVMMSPFFAAAHVLTRWSNLPPDGFSLYYEHAAGLAGAAAFVAGLMVLARFLSRYFPAAIVVTTLFSIAFGTNLFHYATYDSTFSHAFSFLLISLLLELTDRWWAEPSIATSAGLSVVAALIILTRHTNVVFLSMIPLWNAADLWARRTHLTAIAVLTAMCLIPQFAVYKIATGHWLVNPYQHLGRFDLASPHALAALFSVQKGLFFWSPVLAFAAAGFFVPHPVVRRLRAAGAIVFLVNVYLVGAWSDWQFGASFGHRAFTDGFPLAAVFLAAFFEWTSGNRRVLIPVAAATTAAVALSCVQMVQYWIGVLPVANTTWAQYPQLFLRFR